MIGKQTLCRSLECFANIVGFAAVAGLITHHFAMYPGNLHLAVFQMQLLYWAEMLQVYHCKALV